MPATFVRTGGLVVTRANDAVGSFAFSNRSGRDVVHLRPQQLIDLFHFLERHKRTTRTDAGYSANLNDWGDNFMYSIGVCRQECRNCQWLSGDLVSERHSCPQCGAPHVSIDAELDFGTARVQSRKATKRGFYLHVLEHDDSSPVTVNEPDLDALLPMLAAMTGLAQMHSASQAPPHDPSAIPACQSNANDAVSDNATAGRSTNDPEVTASNTGPRRPSAPYRLSNRSLGKRPPEPTLQPQVALWERRLWRWLRHVCRYADDRFGVWFNYHTAATGPFAAGGLLAFWVTGSTSWLIGVGPYALPYMVALSIGGLALMLVPYFATVICLSDHGLGRFSARLIAICTQVGAVALLNIMPSIGAFIRV